MSNGSDLNRRGFCGRAALTVAAVPLGLVSVQAGAKAMGTTEVAQQATGDTSIRPFRVNTSEAELADMRRRINATRWPERETVADTSQGVPLAVMQTLASYWATGYDWRKCEAKLNALPQFVTEIDGLDIYFIHVRSKHENALPIIVTHGWPGSPIEQLKIIDPLTNPTAYGASASDAFHVVIPAIPGYGFSSRPSMAWGPDETARAWTELMRRLGYTKFVAQGGDVGAIVTSMLGEQAPPELLGIHSNFPYVVPPAVGKALRCGDPPSPSFSADEKRAYEQLVRFTTLHFAYGAMNRTRPQTLYGLTDPIGLAAWLLDHGDGWGQPAPVQLSAILGQPVDGHSADGFTRDDLLDNFTLYYLTNTGISSCRFYWYIKSYATSINVPAAISIFPGEIYQAPRSWTATVYHNIIYYSIDEIPKGGHFAAWEQPQIFSEELRKAFKSLRSQARGQGAGHT
jgi:pimeloyl-ACP methyl ester carboxylesterase